MSKETFVKFIRTADSPSGKTQTWDVRTRTDDILGERLGFVRWFGRWRCYAFFPVIGTVFEKTCLRDIATFCEHRTSEHRGRKRGAAA